MAWELNTFFYINKKCMGAHGFGKFIGLDGTIYIGNWENDKQNGSGREIYSDGSNYMGEFVDGKKSGKGKFTFTEGNTYEGDFMIMK